MSRLLKKTIFTLFATSCLALSFSVWASDDLIFENMEKLQLLQESSEKLGREVSKSLEKGSILSGGQINRLSKTITSYHQLFTPVVIEALNHPLKISEETAQEVDLHALMIHVETTRQIFSLLNTYFQEHNLRRLVTEMMRFHPTDNNIVKESFAQAKFFLQKKSIDRLLSQLKKVQKNLETRGEQNFSDKELRQLSVIFRDDLIPHLTKEPKLPHKGKVFLDATASFINALTEYGSWVVGNTAGNINWREGHLKKHPRVIEKIRNKLKPFDVLVEKAPFIMTDYMIPGHFGHVALYLGNEEQLLELGLWNHPKITPFQEKIRQGYNMMEAVRSGVRLTSLGRFSNVDELAILRVKNIPKPHKVLETALAQLSKEYDFNFDVLNPLSLICSELIYLSHGHISWPTENILGRPTISPDHLVELAFYRQSPLKFVGYWGAKAKMVIEHREEDLAARVNFFPAGLSRELEKNYERHVQKCEKVIKNRVRVNSTRSGYLETASCITDKIVNTYQAEVMDESDFWKLLRSRSLK